MAVLARAVIYIHIDRNKQMAINSGQRQTSVTIISIICLYRILFVNYNYCVVLLTHYINICLLHNHIDTQWLPYTESIDNIL